MTEYKPQTILEELLLKYPDKDWKEISNNNFNKIKYDKNSKESSIKNIQLFNPYLNDYYINYFNKLTFSA